MENKKTVKRWDYIRYKGDVWFVNSDPDQDNWIHICKLMDWKPNYRDDLNIWWDIRKNEIEILENFKPTIMENKNTNVDGRREIEVWDVYLMRDKHRWVFAYVSNVYKNDVAIRPCNMLLAFINDPMYARKEELKDIQYLWKLKPRYRRIFSKQIRE